MEVYFSPMLWSGYNAGPGLMYYCASTYYSKLPSGAHRQVAPSQQGENRSVKGKPFFLRMRQDVVLIISVHLPLVRIYHMATASHEGSWEI